MTRGLPLLLGIAVTALTSSSAVTNAARHSAAADTVQCSLEAGQHDSAHLVKQADGSYIDYAGGGVTVTCPARHYVLTSDSAEYHEAQQYYYFIGHVHYTEPRVKVTSDILVYWQVGDSVHAVRNVHAVDSTGSTLDGPRVLYYHASPGIRLRDQVLATDAPTMKIAQRDSLGHPDSAITVSASNTLFKDGDSLLYASQKVVITRASMVSHSDSAFLDQRGGADVTHLIGNPVINGEHGRPFELIGTLIDAYFPNRKVNRILARGQARATSEGLSLVGDTIDIRVTNDQITRVIGRLAAVATNTDSVRGEMQLIADTIDLRVNNNLLERAIAWNRTKQAAAISSSQRITADSIDVWMPGQQVRRMDAVRHALATAVPDSSKMKTTERDAIWGDTIVAFFDTVPPHDTAKKTSLRRIIASGDTTLWTKTDSLRARAYYHLGTGDTIDRRPAITYDRAKRRITMDFASGAVSLITMVEGVDGIYVTPLDSARAKADSAKTPAKKPPPTEPRTK